MRPPCTWIFHKLCYSSLITEPVPLYLVFSESQNHTFLTRTFFPNMKLNKHRNISLLNAHIGKDPMCAFKMFTWQIYAQSTANFTQHRFSLPIIVCEQSLPISYLGARVLQAKFLNARNCPVIGWLQFDYDCSANMCFHLRFNFCLISARSSR